MPPPGVDIVTPRLWLRRWRPEDLEPFAALNADPQVMEHFPSTLSREETSRRCWRGSKKHFEKHGYGLWAVEVPGQAPFIGFIGLAVPSFEASFTPCVEIGWRLTRPLVGKRSGDGRGPRRAGVRVRAPGLGGNRGVHGTGQHALTPRDGEAGDAVFGRLRASPHGSVASTVPSRAVSTVASGVG